MDWTRTYYAINIGLLCQKNRIEFGNFHSNQGEKFTLISWFIWNLIKTDLKSGKSHSFRQNKVGNVVLWLHIKNFPVFSSIFSQWYNLNIAAYNSVKLAYFVKKCWDAITKAIAKSNRVQKPENFSSEMRTVHTIKRFPLKSTLIAYNFCMFCAYSKSKDMMHAE